MNPLQMSSAGGTYAISCQMLLTNSDAHDPQGYPMVFVVDGVTSGSLMINGSPFGPSCNTISNNVAVIWTPPPVMAAVGTPCFQVHVFDGITAVEFR